MPSLYLHSKGDIDFTFLQRRVVRSEERNPQLISYNQLRIICASSSVPIEVKKAIVLLYDRQKDLNVHHYPYTKSDSDCFLHPLSYFYENGVIKLPGYTLVEVDLLPSIIDIISIISGMPTPYSPADDPLTDCLEELRDFISANYTTDEAAQSALVKIVETQEPVICAYIHKCLELSKRKNIKIIDLFQLEREFEYLNPIESIIYPLAYSLNTLQYAFVEKLSEHFKRGEKRFAITDRYRMYFFVEKPYLEKMLDTQVFLDGARLNIPFKVIHEFYVEESEHALQR